MRAGRMQALAEPVLVTGAAGFMGRRLVNRLLHEGKQVRGFDIVACPESLEGKPGLAWFSGDISVPHSLSEAMKGCSTVFHLAAMVGDWGAPEAHHRVTVEGTRHCFEEALRQSQLRVVLASSIVVYGQQIGEGVCHEALPFGHTFGPYSASKQAQEKLAQGYLQRGLDVRVVRPANVYGAGSRPWVEALSKELLRGLPVLISGGDYDAGLVHVDNVVEVLVRAARLSNAAGQIYNAADEEGITWKQYMRDLAVLINAPVPRSMPRPLARYLAWAGESAFRTLRVGQRPPITREAYNLVGSHHRISMSKTRKQLRYAPLTSYKKGLEELASYLKAG